MDRTTIYVLGSILVFALFVCAQFPVARWLAHLKVWKKVNILGGMAQYIFWDKNEAVIITRGGKEKVLQDEGGERFIYPLRGERLRARVSLADQLLTSECVVDIFELVPCKLKVVVRWAVDEPSTYINKNDSARHLNKSGEIVALDIMEVWLKVLTEEISLVVSQESFQAGFLHMILLKESKRLAFDQHSNITDDINPRVAKISETLGNILQAKLNEKSQAYGVRVVGAAIPSIGMDARVREQLLAPLLKRLAIEEAESEARVRQITEEAQIEIDRKRHAMHRKELGRDAARILEVMKHISPQLKVNQEDFLKIIIGLEGRNSSPDLGSNPDLTGQEPYAIEAPEDEPES